MALTRETEKKVKERNSITPEKFPDLKHEGSYVRVPGSVEKTKDPLVQGSIYGVEFANEFTNDADLTATDNSHNLSAQYNLNATKDMSYSMQNSNGKFDVEAGEDFLGLGKK